MRIMKILLSQSLDEQRIAYKRPIEVQSSSTFVVDLTKLAHPDDIKKDSYGRWLHKGSHNDVFRCSYGKDGDVNIEKTAPGATGQNVYYLRRLHCVHPSHSDFRRILAFICGTSNVYKLLSDMMSYDIMYIIISEFSQCSVSRF